MPIIDENPKIAISTFFDDELLHVEGAPRVGLALAIEHHGEMKGHVTLNRDQAIALRDFLNLILQ